jgi:hypothetical protein
VPSWQAGKNNSRLQSLNRIDVVPIDLTDLPVRDRRLAFQQARLPGSRPALLAIEFVAPHICGRMPVMHIFEVTGTADGGGLVSDGLRLCSSEWSAFQA